MTVLAVIAGVDLGTLHPSGLLVLYFLGIVGLLLQV